MEKTDKSIKKVFERDSGEKFPITFQMKDGTLMVNATQMGKAYGELKKPVYFLRSKGTRAFINVLKKELDNGENSHRSYIKVPYITVTEGRPSVRGTWMHERLALKYAAWIAPSFENWVYKNITELLKTGKVELDRPNPMSMEEHLDEQTQRTNSLLAAKEVYRQTDGDVASIPQYYYDLTMKLTGEAPRGWVKIGKDMGLPPSVTRKGGREVMRTVSPKYTCALSLADNILTSQKHLSIKNDLQYVVDEVKKGIPMFEGLLKLGVKLPELKVIKAKF